MMEKSRWKEIVHTAEDYEASTAVPCSFITLTGETPTAESCRFCSRLEQECALDTRCLDTHRYAAYQAERFGGIYHYFCRFSLLHWASPVILDGLLQGALVCGPVLIIDPDKLYFEECRDTFRFTHEEFIRFKQEIAKVERISPSRANSLSNLLFMASLALSDANARTFFADREAFEQQSRIGEYLQHLKTMEGDKRSDFNYPMEKEKLLLKYTAEGRKREAEALLDEILGFVLYSTGTRLEMVKSRILELAVLLSRAAVEGGADVEEIFGLNYHYLIRIRELSTIEELTRWTLRIMDRFIDLVFTLRNVQHTHKILQVIKYVKQHFSEKITLQEVSDSIHISSSYLSRLFKSEMGRSFSDYLGEQRIEESKKRLLETDLPLGDIAYGCGFEDQSYFTKVFKKKTGIAPSRFRESRGRILPYS